MLERHVPQVGLELYLPRSPILSASETARLMGFRSGEALSKARQAGRLPIEMFQLPGRRGWFAATHVVKAWLEASLTPTVSPPSRTGGNDVSG
jgi:hypothetical protein